MNIHTITLPTALAVLTFSLAPVLTSCAPLKQHIKDAVQDLDVQGIAQEHACGLYISKGRDQAEQIYASEWPLFAPVFETPPNAAADLQWCTESIRDLGAHITNKHRSESSLRPCAEW